MSILCSRCTNQYFYIKNGLNNYCNAKGIASRDLLPSSVVPLLYGVFKHLEAYTENFPVLVLSLSLRSIRATAGKCFSLKCWNKYPIRSTASSKQSVWLSGEQCGECRSWGARYFPQQLVETENGWILDLNWVRGQNQGSKLMMLFPLYLDKGNCLPMFGNFVRPVLWLQLVLLPPGRHK